MKNDLIKQVNFFVSDHRKKGSPVSVYYPLKHFPKSDLQSIRKRLNRVCYDVQSRTIIQHAALIIYDLPPWDYSADKENQKYPIEHEDFI